MNRISTQLKNYVVGLLIFCGLIITSFVNAQNSDAEATKKYLGTWKGTFSRQFPDSSVVHSSQIIWRIHRVGTTEKRLYLTQISDYNNQKLRVVTKRFNLDATLTNGVLLILAGDQSKEGCILNFDLNVQTIGNNSYLSGKSPASKAGCPNVTISLKSIDRDTTDYIENNDANNTQSKILVKNNSITQSKTITSSQKSEPVYNSNFKIDKKDITLPTDKDFKWYALKDAPQSFKIAFDAIPYIKNETLATEISKQVTNGCEVKVAAIDLNNNGIYGFIIYGAGNYCCGSQGCSFEIFEDGGTKTLFVTDYEIIPSNNSIKTSAKVFLKFNDEQKISSQKRVLLLNLFRYQNVPPSKSLNNIGLVGGSTPDELGRILLRALQKNNQNLWMSCTHPESDVVDQAFNEKRFKEFRKWMEEDGVSDWTQVKFSRVTFDRSGFGGGSDNGDVDGDQVRRNFAIEFTYKKGEFLGRLGLMTISTYNKGKKFLIWWPGKDTGLRRKIAR